MDDLKRLYAYVDWLALDPRPKGDARKGEIEIVSDIEAVKAHQLELERRAAAAGKPLDHVRIGIMHEDQYVWFVRDPVLFPPKPGETEPTLGAYIRVVYKNALSGDPGIFILAFDREGRLILNRTYRHAARSWMLEGQGTIAREGENVHQSIARCVRDEIGLPIGAHARLAEGYVPERGLVGDAVPMFVVHLKGTPSGTVRDRTVAGHVLVDVDAYLAALKGGVMVVDGIPHRLHDGYTMSAVLLAGLLGHV